MSEGYRRLRLSLLLPLALVACLLPHATSIAQCDRRQKKTWPQRVLPGMPSFPSSEDFDNLARSLNGSLLTAQDASYTKACSMHNLRVVAKPHAIVYVASLEDVQKVVVFAKRYNLWVSVRSSGHSFVGRSTHDKALIVNLGQMKGRKFNLNSSRSPAGEVTVESGNSWMEVYKAVDEQITYDDAGKVQRRVIVGGSAHTVAMGGYTQGGGHSPICRQLGLAVDSLLEATIVLANGTVAVVNEQGTTLTDLDGRSFFTTDTSLFWAIQGGGGGTWGVVISFTFKLHFAPKRFRNVVVNWALNYLGYDIGTGTIKFVLRQLTRLSRDWGGYMIVSGSQLTKDVTGSLTLFLNHWGSDDSPSNSDIDAILSYNVTKNQYGIVDRNFSTFLEYEVHAVDPDHTYIYLYDSFIQPTIVNDNTKLGQLTAFLMGLKNAPTAQSAAGCTATLIGGKMGEVASGVTPVNPKFRSGLLAMSCALGWADGPSRDDFYINHALKMRDALAEVGEGVYFNEPAEDLDDWKVQFWGDANNYQQLLDAKRKWDPDHFFWCHNCVGSDLDATYGPIRDDDGPVCVPASASPRSMGVLSSPVKLLLFLLLFYITVK